jgi:fructokinase
MRFTPFTGKPSPAREIAAVGELLWDILPSGAVLGGAPANFAYRVHSLGGKVSLISRLGSDDYGKRARDEISARGVNTSLIQADPKLPTGTVDVFLTSDGLPTYTINKNVAYDNLEATQQALEAARSAGLVCFGSLIQRAPNAQRSLRQMLQAAEGAVKLLDVNLRRDCYGPETVSESLKACDILKLNNTEAVELNQMFDLKASDLCDFCARIIERFQLSACVVTLGGKGVLGFSASGEKAFSPGYKVTVIDTIGSGDSFTAGFSLALLDGQPLYKCCELGNKLGALVAGRKGGMAELRQAEIEECRLQPGSLSLNDCLPWA